MTYSTQEETNLKIVKAALEEASSDFAKLADAFSEDIEWTIVGHGPVARTFHGMKDLLDNGETALFERIAGTLSVRTNGLWADGDKVFVHMSSSGRAIDDKPYKNEYMYILTMKDSKAVASTAWLDLYAYYDIINRVSL
jgi:ketosteroid isomerase-like protein